MPKLTKDEIIAVIYSELTRSTDFANASLTEIRGKAWNYFLNRHRGDEIPGRSQVQDTSVRDVVHALMAQIMPAYATDHIISFETAGPDDIDQAEAESSAVNNLFTETNQGFLELSNAIQDALLMRNGIMKVHVEEHDEVSSRAFSAPVADVLAQAPPDQDWSFTETDSNGLNHFKIKSTVQKLKTEAIEPALIFLDPNQDDQNLEDADFIAELVFFTRSELLQMGIAKEIVEELPNTPDKATPQTGRSNLDILAKFIDGIADTQGQTAWDRQEIECNWVHMKIDRDGDGISERSSWSLSGAC